MKMLKIRIVAAALAAIATAPVSAGTYDLTIGSIMLDASGTLRPGLAINGSIPAPTLRFAEGEDLIINVTNTLDVDSSIHWHGVILPFTEDGVPGLSFAGIKPGTTHTYRFPAQQPGTYWYHSHSGLQEQAGMYGAIIIDPKGREPFRFDREYVVVLSDWHDSRPEQILANLKKQSDYYNFQQRTLMTFFDDVEENGFAKTLADRFDWGEMRMTPTDIADVSGYTFLINGKSPAQNWTALFEPGERVRLRFINAAAMTFFDVRIPGLPMTVVQADGNNVQPVKVDEFRIAVAETYDVIVRPKEAGAFTIFAESMARTGHARATLTSDPSMTAAVPPGRQPPLLSMADMGHAHAGMDHGDMAGMDHGDTAEMDHGDMAEMDHGDMAGMDHSAMAAADPFYAPGSGLLPSAADGGRFLSYTDLRAQKPKYPDREPDREIEIRLTGNMERYMWSINDLKFSQAQPIRLALGERVRFKFVNETMMTHPMHLHGMWSILDVGAGKWNPAKHTISVSPGTTVYAEVEADAPGRWAFHCHLMYHMASGMFREVLILVLMPPALAGEGDDQVFTFFRMDQNEVRLGDHDGYAWEAQGWIGTDFDKAYLKTKGELEFGGGIETAEVQLLYSRLVSDFFDVQAGVRYDFEPHPSRAHAVLGLQGLAPQWFEVDAALFVSDHADVTARFEAEYDLLITQRLILQPLFELELAAQDIDERDIGAGLTGIELGLRLRYEIVREIAPYIGIAYERHLFRTADIARGAGHDVDSLAFVAGLRLFF